MRINPFTADIHPDGVPPLAGALTLHHEALEDLEAMIGGLAEIPAVRGLAAGGTVVLLRAPRAGYGKTCLLARLRERLAGDTLPAALEFDLDGPIDWKTALGQLLDQWNRPAAGNSGPTWLDHIARRLFALANEGLIRSGRVPCAHPDEAVEGLQKRYLELFDFSDPAQPVAKWFLDHFERLLPESAPVLAEAAGITSEAATFWLRVLCGYADASADGDGMRLEGLRWALRQPGGPGMTAGGMHLQSAAADSGSHRQRLVDLTRLAAAVRPTVIVLDHLDGFHTHSAAVLRIATLLSEWRRVTGRVVFILSVNQDLWAQTFQKALPSALEDRLTGRQLTLGGIGREEAEALLRTRLEEAGAKEDISRGFLAALRLDDYFSQEAGRMVYPRAVLRHAARKWEEWNRGGRAVTAPVSTAAPAAPAAEIFAPFPPAAVPVPAAAMDAGPGEDDSFRRLREVLERLKSKNQEKAAGPGNGNAEIRSSAPPPAGNGGFVSGVILPDPVAPPRGTAPTQSEAPKRMTEPSPFLTPLAVPADHSLQVRFHTLKAHFSSAPWLIVDHDRLFHLMRIAGQRLAVVRYAETGLPGLPGLTAGVWQSPDSEIVFGSEPHDDRNYWAALTDFVRQRSTVVSGCRLVLFSSSQAPVNLGGWMRPDEIVEARGHFLDVQTLDQPSLAALYALDELLREAERGALGANVSDTFAALAPHVEFLWHRLTRPLSTR